MLLIGPLGRNLNEILIAIYTFSFKKIHLKMSFGKCRPFCLGLNVLTLQSKSGIGRDCWDAYWELLGALYHLRKTNDRDVSRTSVSITRPSYLRSRTCIVRPVGFVSRSVWYIHACVSGSSDARQTASPNWHPGTRYNWTQLSVRLASVQFHWSKFSIGKMNSANVANLKTKCGWFLLILLSSNECWSKLIGYSRLSRNVGRPQ